MAFSSTMSTVRSGNAHARDVFIFVRVDALDARGVRRRARADARARAMMTTVFGVSGFFVRRGARCARAACDDAFAMTDA